MTKLNSKKLALLQNMNTCLWTWLRLRCELSNRKMTWDPEPGMLGTCIGHIYKYIYTLRVWRNLNYRSVNREEWDGRAMWRVWRRGEVCTRFWLGNLRERDHWGDPDVVGRIILRWIFRKWEGVVGTGWIWLRIGTGGWHLWIRRWTFGFQKCGEFLD